MKRKIKFKAKTQDTGEWVVGSYVYLPDSESHHIIPYGSYKPHIDLFEVGHVEVDPTSISQYIGYKDRNGVDIYENDIILFHESIALLDDEFEDRLLIFWDDISMEWICEKLLEPGVFMNITEVLSCNDQGSWIEVIGNEYDNPELLKPLDVWTKEKKYLST